MPVFQVMSRGFSGTKIRVGKPFASREGALAQIREYGQSYEQRGYALTWAGSGRFAVEGDKTSFWVEQFDVTDDEPIRSRTD